MNDSMFEILLAIFVLLVVIYITSSVTSEYKDKAICIERGGVYIRPMCVEADSIIELP